MRSIVSLFLLMFAVLFSTLSHAQSRNFLKMNEFLKTNEYLVADNKGYFAIIQGDGNFCVYRGSGPADNKGGVSCSLGKSAGPAPYFAVMQGDGNFCVYRGTDPGANKGHVWCKGVAAVGSPLYAVLQDDGQLVVKQGTEPACCKVSVAFPGAAAQIVSGDGKFACGRVCRDCANQNQCSFLYPRGTSVTFRANPNDGNAPGNWSGPCSHSVAQPCTFSVSAPATVTAGFTARPTFTLTAKPATGGQIASSGMQCPNACSTPVNANTNVSISATPHVGYVFGSWGGACANQGSNCNLAMNGDKAVSANFTHVGTWTVTVTPPGPEGQVGDNSRMACGQVCANCAKNRSCSKPVNKGDQVSLRVSLNPPYRVKNWTGACAGQTGTACSFKADSDKTVGLEFAR